MNLPSLSAAEMGAICVLITMPTSELCEDSDTEDDEFNFVLPLETFSQQANDWRHAETLTFPAMEGLRGLYSTRLYAGDAEDYFKPVIGQGDLLPLTVTNWLVPNLSIARLVSFCGSHLL